MEAKQCLWAYKLNYFLKLCYHNAGYVDLMLSISVYLF